MFALLPLFPYPPIGGEESVGGTYPWMAVIGMRRHDDFPEWFCGGSLISLHLVITAAHCLQVADTRLRYSADVVRLGAQRLGVDRECEDADDYNITRTHVHPHFDITVSVAYHDLALIELDTRGNRPKRWKSFLVPFPGT